MPCRNSTARRKVIKRACDACKIRKIKCSELPPCGGCAASGISCTFRKTPSTRGPRNLRPKTISQISKRQKQYAGPDSRDNPPSSYFARDASSTPSNTVENQLSEPSFRTSIASLVLRLRIYRLRLFPIWPILAAEDIIASLQRDGGDEETYTLANAVAAATMAQLKLDSSSHPDAATGSSLEAECRRARSLIKDELSGTLNSLRIAFFLHIYHENQEAGGVKSLLYLREAITLAQIMSLHRETAYSTLSTSEQEIRRRILWLLFVTERGVAMLHNLPVVLKCDAHFPSTEGDDGSHILPAFLKLINLFWIFDQSGAFDLLQSSSTGSLSFSATKSNQISLETVQKRLQDVPIDWESSNDVQRADICVTRQWMRAVLWKAAQNGGLYSSQSAFFFQPVQIAKEFLAVISKIPTAAVEAHGPSIFKIYEIASVVADAMANDARVWRAPVHAREVLSQLHRILASCRGGNLTLASMLHLKIVQIQHREQSLLDYVPRVEELDDQWTCQVVNPHDFNSGLENLAQPNASPTSFSRLVEGEDRDRAEVVNEREIVERGNFQFGGQFLLSGFHEFQWTTTIGQNLIPGFSDATEICDQLQAFDDSFGDFQLSDIADPLPLARDTPQGVVAHASPNMLSTNFIVSQ